MRGENATVIENKSSLYELAMSFGDSLDIETNCHSFFSKLIDKCKLTSVAYLNNDFFYTTSQNPIELDSNLKKHLFEYTNILEASNATIIIDSQSPIFSSLQKYLFDKANHFFIYNLGLNNLLIFCRTYLPFDDYEQGLLIPVVQKFGNFARNILSISDSKTAIQKETRVAQLLKPNTLPSEDSSKEAVFVEMQLNYEALYQNMFDAIFFYDFKNEKIIDCNQAALDLLQFGSKKEIIGKNRFEFVPRDSIYFKGQDLHQFMEFHKSEVLNGKRVQSLTALTTKEGKELYALVNMIPSNQTAGLGFFIINDKTEIIKAKIALEKSKNKYKNFIENSPCGISIFDLNGDHLYASPRSIDIFGYKDIDKPINIFHYFPEKEHDKIKNLFKQTTETEEKTIKTELTGLSGNNEEIQIEAYIKSKENEICLVFNDITEKISINKKLQVALSNYVTLYQNMFDAIFLYNYNKEKIIDCNEASLKLFGYTEQEFLSLNRYDIIPEHSPYYEGNIHRNIVDIHAIKVNQGETIKARGIFKTKNNEPILAEVNIVPTFINPGEAFIIVHNTTNAVLRKKALKASEQKHRNIFDNSIAGIIYIDIKQKKSIICNQIVVDLFGLDSKEELLSMPLQNLYSSNEENKSAKDFFEYSIEATIEKGEHASIFKAKKKDGTEFVISSNMVLDLSKPENPMIIFFLTDITIQYYAQKELEERTAIYEALIEKSFSGIDIIEIKTIDDQYTDGNLIVRNEKMKYFFENSEDPLLSADKFAPLCPETQPNGLSTVDFFNDNTTVLINNQSLKHDWRLKHNNGKIIDLEVINQILEVNDKKILIRIYDDVTSKKQQQQTIKKQLKVLSKKNQELYKYIESNGELENFAYVASHDLQAPLRTISSFTGLLKRKLEGRLEESEKEYMEFVIDATKNMQLLIRDLLTYSRVNTNKCQYVPVNLNRALEDIILQLSTVIQEKQANVNLHSIPEFIEADQVKIKQLFQNLITNALKFSKTDTPPIINISCKDEGTEWLFKVEDNGIGIDPKYKEEIFMLFRRLHTNETYKGTGIGLALCKKIVEQHKGNIGIDSEFGKGCTFYFTIQKKLIK